jgi:hypothetical protein
MGGIDLAAKRSFEMLTNLMISAAPHIGHTYQPPGFAESQTEQNQEFEFTRSEDSNPLFGSSEFLSSSARAIHGFDQTLSAGEYSDSFQHQFPLGVPGINILARTGFDNISLLSGYPFQTIAHEPPTTDDNVPMVPMHMGSTDPQLWDWQNFPTQPSHGSQRQSPSQGFSSQMYQIGSQFAPNYPVYGQNLPGSIDDHSTSETASGGHRQQDVTQSPGQSTDPQY